MNTKTYRSSITNALKFSDGCSFSDGGTTVGIGEDGVAIAFGDMLHNKNQLIQLTDKDAQIIYALLTSALRAKGLLLP